LLRSLPSLPSCTSEYAASTSAAKFARVADAEGRGGRRVCSGRFWSGILADVSELPPSKDAPASLPIYDESEWPIFQVKMPPVALSAEAFQAHLEACAERYRRGKPFCMLIDMGQHPPLGAVRRKAVADRMVEDGRRFPRVMLGCALVVHSATSRGGVTAINWVAQPAYSFTAFEDMGEARMWLAHLLEEHRAGRI